MRPVDGAPVCNLIHFEMELCSRYSYAVSRLRASSICCLSKNFTKKKADNRCRLFAQKYFAVKEKVALLDVFISLLFAWRIQWRVRLHCVECRLLIWIHWCWHKVRVRGPGRILPHHSPTLQWSLTQAVGRWRRRPRRPPLPTTTTTKPSPTLLLRLLRFHTIIIIPAEAEPSALWPVCRSCHLKFRKNPSSIIVALIPADH